ncbi:hypothetical protein JHK82_044488 [Glycine max]|uniref:Uncharacterized protein n=2 Tax=Glycine subgen. Soja TaxID=1462606 RepID=A0A0R0FYN3_SOYBN|nr:hypothetical protein JHK86_044837 [Glycine max]KAG4940814.1 hypothetical protein JHK87_044685 [Glycine soja]KAG4951585.1 hypothetical protein JHK85_045452 [Glycine max]KAG5099436.1 hypothetical protein JHK82_044488 [Glycine max]KAG5108041.1 hypothetical protein JHK84_044948 [Glycine max]
MLQRLQNILNQKSFFHIKMNHVIQKKKINKNLRNNEDLSRRIKILGCEGIKIMLCYPQTLKQFCNSSDKQRAVQFKLIGFIR